MLPSTPSWNRSRLLLLGAALLLVPLGARAEEPGFVKKTYTYKTVGDVPIRADVYRPDDSRVRPAVIWIHGGALIVGSRTAVPRQLMDLCRQEGFALVSLDYRLAPEVKLPAIIEDIEDAFRWLGEQGVKRLHIDPERMVVAGGSAGGYLTLMTGFRVKPRPVALVAYWGYGDVDGDWYTKPSEYYRKKAPLVSKEEAYRVVGGGVLTGTEGNEHKDRGRFYLYLRQNGLWTKEVTGFDPDKDRQKLDAYCPVRNVSRAFPPTLLIHGTKDTDVPYELSAAMAKELARHEIPHELVTVKGAGHGLAGGDKKLVDDAHEKAAAFIRARLRGEKSPKERNRSSAMLSVSLRSTLLLAADLPADDSVKPVEVLIVPQYSEGIVFDHDGNAYISHGKIITQIGRDGKARKWAETGAPNGHKVLADGTHLVCDASQHAVLHLDAEGNMLPPASKECDGKPLRGPNDLTLDPKGGFYFTDPGDSSDKNPNGTVHYVDPQGKTHLVASGLAYSNGIVLRPDGKTLLVAESKHNRILAYPVREPGKVGEKKVFAELPAKRGDQIDNQPDGICLDAEGNLYVAHYGMHQVQVLNPEGRLLHRYPGGTLTTSNVAFGGPNMDQLYVTGALGQEKGSKGALFRLDLKGVKGLVILPKRR